MLNTQSINEYESIGNSLELLNSNFSSMNIRMCDIFSKEPTIEQTASFYDFSQMRGNSIGLGLMSFYDNAYPECTTTIALTAWNGTYLACVP